MKCCYRSRMWGRVKQRLLGIAFTILGLFVSAAHWGWHFLDIFGRLDLLWQLVKAMGGTPSIFASIVSSQWFGLSLIVMGVAHMIFIGEPKKGAQRHPWLPYFGWSIFAICLTAVILVPSLGAIQIYLSREVNRRVDDYQRKAAPTFWTLTDEQRRLLIAALNTVPESERFAVTFLMLIGSNQSQAFAQEIMDVFSENGWKVSGTMDTQLRPNLLDVHLIVPEGTKSEDDLSPQTRRLAGILTTAQIRFQGSHLKGSTKEAPPTIAIGAGPSP